MADDYTTLTLVGRHVPEPMVNAAGNPASPQELGHDVIDPVTGVYEIGAIIEGAFVPILTEKASLVFDAINLAKQQQASQPEQAQPAQEVTPADASGGSSQPETGPLSDQGQAQPDQPQG